VVLAGFIACFVMAWVLILAFFATSYLYVRSTFA
jgi:hypothetical protein